MPVDLFSAESIVAFLTLLTLEIVLGIDNVIFIAILTGKLPEERRSVARTTGISLAVITRILLLFSVTWIMGLTEALVSLPGLDRGLSGRDLILLAGGLFLIAKSTHEIHGKLEAEDHGARETGATATFASVIVQILIIDVVFSLDSVITAVGISGELWIMVPAVLIAAFVMVVFAGPVSRFIERHPTTKVLALAFLILIGTMLVMEGINPDAVHDLHLKNYAYFAMAFSFLVEMINIRVRRAGKPVALHNEPRLKQE